ncbi:MAG: ankyrin repeat domain-containing protein [Elusimicrobiota bacterium]
MKSILRLLPLFLLMTAACSKDDGRNSVWLAVSNESGRDVRGLTLVCGKATLTKPVLAAGRTQAGWARLPKPQPLSLSFIDQADVRQTPDVGADVSPSLIGGRVLLTLHADGSVVRLDEPSLAPPRSLSHTIDDFINDNAPWLAVVLGLMILPPLVYFFRKTKAAAQDAGARLKDMAAKVAAAATAPATVEAPRDRGAPGATQLAAAAALGLTRKVCPVSMFSNDSSRPEFWYEGTLDGRMVGLLDHGRIWLGAPDEKIWYAFERGKDGAFLPDQFFEGETPPVYLDPELPAMMARFSPAVTKVGFLSEAVEAMIDWSRASADSVTADAKLLAAIRNRAEAGEPPLLRAVRKGDLASLNAALASHADLESVGISHDTALAQASYCGRGDMVATLLNAGAKAQSANGYPLHVAARLGHLEVVRAFLDAGVPPDTIGRGDYTPLMDAADCGQTAVVELLLSRGASALYKDKDGRSALSLAKYHGFEPLAELLTKAGAKG